MRCSSNLISSEKFICRFIFIHVEQQGKRCFKISAFRFFYFYHPPRLCVVGNLIGIGH